MGARSNASGGRSSARLVRMLASFLALLVLAPAGVGAEERVSREDCEEAITATAEAYESGRTPDPGTEQLARDCTTPVGEGPIGEATLTTNTDASGAIAHEEVTRDDCEDAVQAVTAAYEAGEEPDVNTEALARECVTPVSVEETEPKVVSSEDDRGTLRSMGTQCKTINAGYHYVNGFGWVLAYFYGNLHWCYNGNKVQGGSFWVNVDRCCFWFYEGIVHSQNLGCFGGCSYVQKHRRGSFIFNPPWPSITTRLQPWFTLHGNKWGGWWVQRGG